MTHLDAVEDSTKTRHKPRLINCYLVWFGPHFSHLYVCNTFGEP